MGIAYSPTPTVEQVDDYHGTLVNAPYRWLEDTEAPATRAWLQMSATPTAARPVPAIAAAQL